MVTPSKQLLDTLGKRVVEARSEVVRIMRALDAPSSKRQPTADELGLNLYRLCHQVILLSSVVDDLVRLARPQE